MRYKITSVISALLALVMIVGCEPSDNVSQTPSNQSSSQSSVTTAETPGDASQPAIVNPIALWPPSTKEEITLADDLFAVNYYVVLDGSGSMDGSNCSSGKSKSAVAKDALVEFAQAVPVNANLGLAIFDKRGSAVEERVPLGLNNRDVFVQKVRESVTQSGTPLKNAVLRGYEALVAQARSQLGYGEYILVIVTDGAPDAFQDPESAIDDIVKNSPVVITTIGFCIGKNHALNRPGKTVYKEANDPAQVKQGLAAVLAESAQFSAIPAQ